MTTKTEVQTLEAAQVERDRLAAEARRQDEIVAALAADRFEVLSAKRQAWARDVLAASTVEATTLATAETAARRAFETAAVDGDARAAFLSWCDARNARNAHRDRMTQALAFLGEPQDDAGYPIKDIPAYSVETDRALASEASSRWLDRQSQLQLELNSLDQL